MFIGKQLLPTQRKGSKFISAFKQLELKVKIIRFMLVVPDPKVFPSLSDHSKPGKK